MKPTVGSTLGSLLCLVLCTVSQDLSQIQVYPDDGGISGVFMVTLNNKVNSFNATEAEEVCTSLGVRIATRAEVEKAHSNGLQTCRFGWTKEKIAFLPRIEKHKNCGQNKVGFIPWPASTSKKFEVFCFNSSVSFAGRTEATMVPTPRITTTAERSHEARVTSLSPVHSTLFNKNFLSPSPSASSDFSTSGSSTFFNPTISSVTTLLPSTSSPSSAVSFYSTILSTHPVTFSSSLDGLSNKTEQPTQPPPRSPFGEVPTACVIIAVMVVLMAAAGAAWYFKIKHTRRLPPWVRIRHKDTVDTEMWKHTDQKLSSKQKRIDEITLQLEEDTESPEDFLG